MVSVAIFSRHILCVLIPVPDTGIDVAVIWRIQRIEKEPYAHGGGGLGCLGCGVCQAARSRCRVRGAQNSSQRPYARGAVPGLLPARVQASRRTRPGRRTRSAAIRSPSADKRQVRTALRAAIITPGRVSQSRTGSGSSSGASIGAWHRSSIVGLWLGAAAMTSLSRPYQAGCARSWRNSRTPDTMALHLGIP